MAKAKRARTAETPKQPSLRLTLRAPYLYPDPRIAAGMMAFGTGSWRKSNVR